MSKFEKVQYFYDRELWTISQVKDAVAKGWITAAQYKTITGEKYEA
jgi:uncharacterized XkdX family phage protein